jgi:hypothetical protein
MKYIPYVIIVGLVAYMILSPKEVEIVDKTDYYEAKIDSITHLNVIFLNGIKKRDLELDASREVVDSLKIRENKVHIFYAKEKRNYHTMSADTLGSEWSRLINNR